MLRPGHGDIVVLDILDQHRLALIGQSFVPAPVAVRIHVGLARVPLIVVVTVGEGFTTRQGQLVGHGRLAHRRRDVAEDLHDLEGHQRSPSARVVLQDDPGAVHRAPGGMGQGQAQSFTVEAEHLTRKKRDVIQAVAVLVALEDLVPAHREAVAISVSHLHAHVIRVHEDARRGDRGITVDAGEVRDLVVHGVTERIPVAILPHHGDDARAAGEPLVFSRVVERDMAHVVNRVTGLIEAGGRVALLVLRIDLEAGSRPVHVFVLGFAGHLDFVADLEGVAFVGDPVHVGVFTRDPGDIATVRNPVRLAVGAGGILRVAAEDVALVRDLVTVAVGAGRVPLAVVDVAPVGHAVGLAVGASQIFIGAVGDVALVGDVVFVTVLTGNPGNVALVGHAVRLTVGAGGILIGAVGEVAFVGDQVPVAVLTGDPGEVALVGDVVSVTVRARAEGEVADIADPVRLAVHLIGIVQGAVVACVADPVRVAVHPVIGGIVVAKRPEAVDPHGAIVAGVPVRIFAGMGIERVVIIFVEDTVVVVVGVPLIAFAIAVRIQEVLVRPHIDNEQAVVVGIQDARHPVEVRGDVPRDGVVVARFDAG